MRVICIVVFVFSALSMVAQTPPAHTYFDTPLIIEDGADIIDSTDYALPDTVHEMSLFGGESGNWYRIIGDEDEYTYITWEVIESSGAWTAIASEIQGEDIQPLFFWPAKSVVKVKPGLVLQFYIAQLKGRDRLKYKVSRLNYDPNNPNDNVEDAQLININSCLEVNTSFSTPSQMFGGSLISDEIDVFYKFTASTSSLVDTLSLPYHPRFELYTDLTNPNYQRIIGERNAIGDKYDVVTDSTYYLRVTGEDPFDTSTTEICLDEFDPGIHLEEDNFDCEDARSLMLTGGSGYMYIDTFTNNISDRENCNEPFTGTGQWYLLEERDSIYNYTLYTDTTKIKVKIHSGSCSELKCLSNIINENLGRNTSFEFSINKGEQTFFYLENIDSDYPVERVFIREEIAGKAEICDDEISIERDTILTIDFSDARHTYEGCSGGETNKDIWLSFLGNGRRVAISRNNRSDIEVYEGSCDSLTCIMTSRGISDYIQTEEGKEYKLGVTETRIYDESSIELDIRFLDARINETYANPILLSCGDTIRSNFDGVARSNVCSYTTQLWYKLPPSDYVYRLKLCSVDGALYTESNGQVICEQSIEFNEEIKFKVEGDKNNLIAINQYSYATSFTPSFELSVGCIEAVENNEIHGAIEVFCDEMFVVNTSNASLSNLNCSLEDQRDNSWYKIAGEDKLYQPVPVSDYNCLVYSYLEIENGQYECETERSRYVPRGDTLYISVSSPLYGESKDSINVTVACQSMEQNRSSDQSEPIVCGESKAISFFRYQDSVSNITGFTDAWYSLQPDQQILSINTNNNRSLNIRIYRKDGVELEEVSYSSMSHIEVPDTSSEYLIQMISGEVYNFLQFDIECIKPAANSSICTAVEVFCQDTIKLDGRQRVLKNADCEISGLPSGYWYKLNGTNRVSISAVDYYVGRPTIISKSETSYDTIEMNYGTDQREYGYLDIEDGKEYYMIFQEGTWPRNLRLECYANVPTNKSEKPVSFIKGELCYEGRYLLTPEDRINEFSLCYENQSFQSGYWFEYFTSSTGVMDLEVVHDNYIYIELYEDDGSPLGCLNSDETEFTYYRWVTRYTQDSLEKNKKYLIKVINPGDHLKFSLCRQYNCEDDFEDVANVSTINICPGVLTRSSIPSYSSEYSYTLSSEATIDSVAGNHLYLQYPSGFGEDSTTLLVSNYCEEDFEKPIVVKEAHPSLCIVFDCAIPNIYISDQLLANEDVPSTIKATEVIQGDFSLRTMDLYLKAGREVILHPGASVGNRAQLEVFIEGCEE